MFQEYISGLLSPFLALPPFWSIVFLSLLITLFITLIYKYATDQHLMKTLKDDLKKFQDEMKHFKEDPKKVLEVQKRAMETNMKYLMHSMKPMLITFLPVILIFGWLNANLAYEPIVPGQEFSVSAVFDSGVDGYITLLVPDNIELISDSSQKIDKEVSWILKGDKGNYILEYDFDNEVFFQNVLITDKQAYSDPIVKIQNNKLKILRIDNAKLRPLNLFGWKIGWLGTYIIFSMVFNLSLRKILKLH